MNGNREATETSLAGAMSGTAAQVEWARGIKRKVSAEFDRIAAVLRSVGVRHNGKRHGEMETILEILEEKRAEVLGREQAGYFIHDWQEINSQARQMILKDPRYEAIKAARNANEQTTAQTAQAPGVPRESADQTVGARLANSGTSAGSTGSEPS